MKYFLIIQNKQQILYRNNTFSIYIHIFNDMNILIINIIRVLLHE